MSLTCGCDTDWYPEPGDWFYDQPGDYTTVREHAPLRTRRLRCQSCKTLINLCDTVIAFPRYRIPGTDVEVNIYGEEGEIPIASRYHCERCADLYLSLTELGFCGMPDHDQRELVKEYADMQRRTA